MNKIKEILLEAKVFKNSIALKTAYYQISQLKEFVSFKNKSILDIGCGNGEFLIMCSLLENVSHCVGLDSGMGKGSSVDIFNIFKSRIDTLGIKNIDSIQKDIFEYDFPKGEFDIVTANYSLHHIELTCNNLLKCAESRQKMGILFKKVYNSLKANGIFVIKEVSRYNFARYLQFYGKLVGTKNIDWLSKHTPGEYTEILASSNFGNIKVKYLVPYIFRKLNLHKFHFFLSNAVTSFFFHSAYYIIAWK